MEGVGVDAEEDFSRGVEAGEIEDAVDEVFGEVVGEEKFFEQAEADEEEGAAAVGGFELFGVAFELLEEVGDAGDGSGEDGGEEGGGGEVGKEGAGGFGVAAVEVEGVGERLEGVEGDAEGEGPLPDGGGHAGEAGVVFKQERHVFECREEAEVQEQRERDEEFADGGPFEAGEAEADREIAGGGQGDEKEVEEVPLGVEEVVGEQKGGEAGGSPAGERPIEEEEGREEEEVGGTGEEHRAGWKQKMRATAVPGEGKPMPASSGLYERAA